HDGRGSELIANWLRRWSIRSPNSLEARHITSPLAPWGASHRQQGLFKGSSTPCTGRAGAIYLGSSEVGYSLRVRDLLGAGSRPALPLRFSVILRVGRVDS